MLPHLLHLSSPGSAPAPPTNLETNAINTTAVNISWDTPTDPDELYIITWCHGNQDTPSSKLIQGYNSILITGLEPGQDCVVMITVNNLCGNEEVQITVAPAITGRCGLEVWLTTTQSLSLSLLCCSS